MAFDPPRLGRGGCCGLGVLGMVFGVCLLLDTCVSNVEVSRIVSVDGRLVATVTETNGGALTDFGYRVEVARNWPIGWPTTAAYLYGATRSDCAYGVNVRWIDDDTLSIDYQQAKDADVADRIGVLGRSVRVVARSGVTDPTAPCGGVAYNLGR
jgi:hypothetical protein